MAVEYLLRTDLACSVDSILESSKLYAPDLLDVEVLSVIRKAVLSKKITSSRAKQAIKDLSHWPLTRVSNRFLIGRAFDYLHNLSAYDALYVALAEEYDILLLTADGPLARSPKLKKRV